VGELVEENIKGAWVVGDARTNGSFSATVQLLTATADLYGACAYASSYPPVGQYVSESEIIFSGTPMYEVTLIPEGGGIAETVSSGSTFLLPCSYTVSSFTDATGAPGIACLRPDIYVLSASASSFCVGSGVQFVLSGTEDGLKYQLFRNNSPTGAVLDGDGSPATFSDTFGEAGVYTAQTLADDVYCRALMSGSPAIATYPVLSPGEIENGTASITSGMNPPSETTVNLAGATGGSGNITYEWRRSGTSSATLTGSAATYALGADAANYGAAGTYYFNRYAKDAVCSWVPATGTYTLNVEASTITFCEECCWAGDAVDISAGTWANCYVTTNTYPFDNPSGNTSLYWTGYGNDTFYSGASGPGSDKNGRRNTAAISVSAGSTTAVGVCKALGTGWYLPAYEEYINMGPSNPIYLAGYPPLNGRAGANIMLGGCYYASTESYGNGGRYSAATPSISGSILVGVRYFSYLSNPIGGSYAVYSCYVHCAWRPLP
jgi:hypothetical protein